MAETIGVAVLKEQSMKVLVVEDSPKLREFITMVLQRACFEVVTASNGQDGLVMARQEMPDVIALDSELPDLQGLEVCRLLKLDPLVRDIPVVIMTGSQDAKCLAGLEAAGAVGHIPKAFNSMTLACELLAFAKLARARLVR